MSDRAPGPTTEQEQPVTTSTETAAGTIAETTSAGRPDADLLKQVNRRFVTGVTLVTVMDGEQPKGLAVNAFANISLDPPTVMVCVQRTSSTYDCLFRATHLAINIASVEQMEVMGRFASKGADKFEGTDWTPGRFGSPVLAHSSAHMEVEIRERLQASTHTVFICRVLDAAVGEAAPVVYSAGRFFDSDGLSPLG